MSPTISIQRLAHAEGLPLPAYETAGAAGMDLRAAVADEEPLVLVHQRIVNRRSAQIHTRNDWHVFLLDCPLLARPSLAEFPRSISQNASFRSTGG